MIETTIKKLSAEEIMQKIKQEVEKRKEPKTSTPDYQNAQFNKLNIVNNAVEPFIQKEVYEYGDFTKYHDIEFIKNCYKGLLKREADSVGLEHYLQLLRNGEKSKSEIISILRYSKEGRSKKVKILGFRKRAIMTAIYVTPILGYLAKSFVTILTLPKLLKRLNQYENFTYQLYMKNIDNELKLQNAFNHNFKDYVDKLNVSVREKVNKIEVEQLTNELKLSINAKINKIEVEKLVKELQLNVNTKANRVELNELVNKLSNNIKAKADITLLQQITNKLQSNIDKKVDIKIVTDEEKEKFDTFYIEFEDKFRGTREDIKQRVADYLVYLEKLPFKKEDIKVLDVGCGRGEWLELLNEKGYKTKGIDLNRVMVAKSQELGLNVEEYDVIEYLKLLKDESLSVITGFHIIEHLPFDILVEMYKESYRVLKSGGMVIFETPNPENVFVGTSNFYTDPTHINPIPPITSQFTLEHLGYKNVTIKRISYSDIHYDDPNINHLFASSTDYAVIGYKI